MFFRGTFKTSFCKINAEPLFQWQSISLSEGKGERIQIQNNPRVFKLEILAPTFEVGIFCEGKILCYETII